MRPRPYIRRLDRATAMRILSGILHYTRTGAGDVEPLHGDMGGAFRLRIGGYRVLFSLRENVILIFGVRLRSEVYR
jgi:mRNA-degrading endonuclease RelE of RelBE toxin-antitoxin system